MHEKVQQFLEQKRKASAADHTSARKETLLKLGLWEKEYGPPGTVYTEVDGEGNYRKIPIPVTDEEWAEIQKYATRTKANTMSLVLRILGICCYIFGAFSYIAWWYSPRFLILFAAIVSGTVCLGLAEVICLLDSHSRR